MIFKNTEPFPYYLIDNLFQNTILDEIIDELKKLNFQQWQFDPSAPGIQDCKFFLSEPDKIPLKTKKFIDFLNSEQFLQFLSNLTGIQNLISDPQLNGGGVHKILTGGKLALHSDFNTDLRTGYYRRLNILIYLNKDWKDEWGGNLELWNKELTKKEVSITPIFNRMVIFETSDFSFHGHPEPLKCPDGFERLSIALYYYTKERPQNIGESNYIAQWKLPVSEIKKDETFEVNQTFKKRIFVVDNFYKNPDKVREMALNTSYSADLRWYKGRRSEQQFLFNGLKETFEKIIGEKITVWEEHSMNGRFQFCTPEDQLVYHHDAQNWAAVLYLNPEAPYQTGTNFYASKNDNCRHEGDPGIENAFVGGFFDKTKFTLVDTIGNVYNRLVIFDSKLIHSAAEYFGTELNNSRLFQIFFFD